MGNLPQDPKASCDPGAPADCEPPNLRLHANPFVTKLNPDGTALAYSTYLGGYGDDAAFGIAVDSAGQAYVTGVADSVNFPGTAEGTIPGFPNTGPTGRYVAHPTCPNCGSHLNGILPPYNSDTPPQFSDAFITKLNAAGNALIYSTYLGGSGDDVAHGLVHSTRAGAHGVYLSGLTGSQDLPPPPDACPPGTSPCPPPPPSPWFKFPVTADAFQSVHAPGRTQRCDGLPSTSTADDYPCSPLPANPSEDAFIVRLNDNADESPAAPIGSGGVTAPDFSISANPSSLSIPLGGPGAGTGGFTVATSSAGGFTGPVSLTASVTPASGLAVSPTSTTVSWGGTAYPATTFNLNATAPGTYSVSIVGTAGALTHTATVSVTVVAPDFSITANPNAVTFPMAGGSASFSVPTSAVGGLSQPLTITPAVTSGLTFTPTSATVSPGSTASFMVQASTSGTRNVTITGSCTACGLGGSNLSRTTVLKVTARPANFTLGASPTSVIVSRDGGSATSVVSISPVDNFTGPITLTNSWETSAPAGLSISPSGPVVKTGAPYSATTFTVTSTAAVVPGTYTVTITGKGGSPLLTRTRAITVVVPDHTGLRSPTINSSANSSGDGNGFEVTPTNAYADDGLFAVDNDSGASSSTSCTGSNKDSHRFYGYGVTIPAGRTVTGLEVRLDAKADSTTGTPKMCVQLSWNGGSSWTTIKSTPTLTTGELTYVLGKANDTWGRTWTAANFTNFQVRIINVSGSGTSDFFLDWVAVKVHYK
jgi:hypothetical protein